MKKSIFKKNILKEASVLLISVFIILSTFAVTGASATDWIKYNDESTENSLGLTSGGIICEAIELTNDKLSGYREYVISEIKVSIGCNAYGAEPGVPYQVWIQNSLPSNPASANVVASGISSSSVWNLINVIDTPIPDSGSVFIGVNFDHNAGQYPCGIDESTSSPSYAGLLWRTSAGWSNLGNLGFDGVWGLSIGVSISTNHPPKTPNKPTGPITGEDEEEYTYTTSTTDPDSDKVKYGWEWTGDNNIDFWTDLYNSGETGSATIVFDEVGTYFLRVKAEDEHGSQSGFSESLTIIIESGNKPPNIPSITGLTEVKVETYYDYTINSIDPEGDNILYWIEWGDGKNSGWVGPYPSGETIMLSHYWVETGDYFIKAIAKDIYGKESDFSTPICINVTASPELDIIIRPSGLGVAATIVNRGKETMVNSICNITLDGGIIFFGKTNESNITEILPGEIVNVFSLVFGFLNVNINVTVGNSSNSLAGFLIGPLFYSNNDEKTFEGKIVKIDSINKEVTIQQYDSTTKKTFKYDSNTKFLDKNSNNYNMQEGNSVKVLWKLNKNRDITERLAIEIHQL